MTLCLGVAGANHLKRTYPSAFNPEKLIIEHSPHFPAGNVLP